MSLLLLFAITWRFTETAPALDEARAAAKPAMLVFVADWCAACRVLERGALADPAVAEEARRFVTAKIDVSSDEKDRRRFGVTALPTILFFDNTGRIEEARVVGTVDAKPLLVQMRAIH
jgi:thiol:disulfide interchange protein DsbD